MDFELSEEQRLLKDSVERLFADRYDFETRQRFTQSAEGFGRDVWKQYADLGLLGLPFEEKHGGFGGGPVETMIVMEAMGRALALEPYLATVVLGGGLLRHAGTDAQRSDILAKIADGTLMLAFAHTERQSRYDLADVATEAKKNGAGWRLDGKKTLVLHGNSADRLIVSARVSGGRADKDGLALFLVDAKADGLSRRGYETVDGLRAAEVTLEGVKVAADAVIGEAGKAFPVIERVVHEAIAALAAEAVGAMTAMHEMTVDYLRQRKQFGVPIGSFQVLQHKAVDMLVAIEQARSMMFYGTMMAAEDDADARRKAMSAVKAQIGNSGRTVGQIGTQLHGGIGMTMEYKGGHYFKRLAIIDTMFGTADHHLKSLARAGGLGTV
ncbi:MAG TPA: acyl-CoA dehydrogenase family protein [Xanthobacteraceae bacterium]|nr:acyl-CoA dehydrogenase family protein [Xanthobacteraceae bacterium]